MKSDKATTVAAPLLLSSSRRTSKRRRRCHCASISLSFAGQCLLSTTLAMVLSGRFPIAMPFSSPPFPQSSLSFLGSCLSRSPLLSRDLSCRKRPRPQGLRGTTTTDGGEPSGLYNNNQKNDDRTRRQKHEVRQQVTNVWKNTTTDRELKGRLLRTNEAIRPQQQEQQQSVPRHIGFICDGNSRWAEGRGLPSWMGHAAGAERLVETLQVLKRTAPQVKVCTFYAFSTENWNRSQPEVEELFRVMEQTIRQFGSKLVRHNVEFRVLGEWTDPRIPASFRLLLRDLQDRTKKQRDGAEDEGDDPDHPILCVAVNYGGRNDLVQAARALARQAVAGEIDPDYITESTLSSRLSTACVPDPDLIVRTSGESRLSNFFLWNAAYSELYFCPELWPDFDSQCLDRALRWYSERKRRFGARGLGSDRRLVSEGRRHTHDQDDGDDGGLRARPGVEIPSGAAREVISASSTQKVHPSFVNGDIRRV